MPLATCESCGQSFYCGATTGACWCAEVKVPDETRDDLRARYEKCLCPACLAQAAKPATQASRV